MVKAKKFFSKNVFHVLFIGVEGESISNKADRMRFEHEKVCENNVSPLESVGFVKKLAFSWLDTILRVGYVVPLESKHVRIRSRNRFFEKKNHSDVAFVEK